nr:MAG: hypothetical protein [Microviridae sp.]
MSTQKDKSQENANGNGNFGFSNESEGTELFERTVIEGTPFVIIHDKQNKVYFAVIGQNRVTELKETEQEVREDIGGTNWGMMINIIAIICKKMISELQTEQQANRVGQIIDKIEEKQLNNN